MKTKNQETERKVQMNHRVRPEYKRAVGFCAGVLGQHKDDVIEGMVRLMFGVADEDLMKKREKLIKTWRAMGETLPFNRAPGRPPELELFAA